MERAGKLLGGKMRSERDLRQKLLERAEPGAAGQAVVGTVLTRLKELGYLSDERFATDYARLRQENEKLGRRRVQQGLMQKGISAPLASAALSKQYDEVDEAALAREYIERKRMKKPEGGPEQKQKETARAMRRLIAAGFSSAAVWKVLRGWGAEVEEVDVVDGDS